MNLNELIATNLKNAMKDGDKFSLSVLRMLKSSLQLESIAKKRDLEENEILAVIKKNVKQRKDSIAEFSKYGKTEEIESLEKEIAILKQFLPEELTEEEIKQKIQEAFEIIKPESIKDMGKIMKKLTDEIGTMADMSVVSKLVKELF